MLGLYWLGLLHFYNDSLGLGIGRSVVFCVIHL